MEPFYIGPHRVRVWKNPHLLIGYQWEATIDEVRNANGYGISPQKAYEALLDTEGIKAFLKQTPTE